VASLPVIDASFWDRFDVIKQFSEWLELLIPNLHIHYFFETVAELLSSLVNQDLTELELNELF
jgi:hypothetical protein